jgi:hypothetical protein
MSAAPLLIGTYWDIASLVTACPAGPPGSMAIVLYSDTDKAGALSIDSKDPAEGRQSATLMRFLPPDITAP